MQEESEVPLRVCRVKIALAVGMVLAEVSAIYDYSSVEKSKAVDWVGFSRH